MTDKVSKWPKELVIIRHGRSERNDDKDAAKQSKSKSAYWTESPIRDMDSPLTKQGEVQAQAVGMKLRDRYPIGPGQIDVLIVSPYLRTRQTAEHILYRMPYKPEVVIEERIREIEFGQLDGLSAAGRREKYPDEVARHKKEGKYYYRPPGGESRPDVTERVRSFLGTLTRDYQGKNVVIICHSVVVLIFRRLMERWDEAEYMQVDREDDVKNCSLTTYRTVGHRLELAEYNYTCEVERPEEVPGTREDRPEVQEPASCDSSEHG